MSALGIAAAARSDQSCGDPMSSAPVSTPNRAESSTVNSQRAILNSQEGSDHAVSQAGERE